MTHEFDLTNRGQNPYSGNMPEPGQGEIQPINQPEQPVTPHLPPNVVPEQPSAREAWRNFYASQGMDIDNLDVEGRRTVDMLIASGNMPGESASQPSGAGESTSQTESPQAAGGGGEPPEEPPTATGGAGGEEPPEEPPTASGGETDGEAGRDEFPEEAGDESKEFRINAEDVEDSRVRKFIRVAEVGYKNAVSSPDKLKVLTDAQKEILMLDSNIEEEDTPENRQAYEKFVSQKRAGESALQEHIAQLGAQVRKENGEAMTQTERAQAEQKAEKLTKIITNRELSYDDKLSKIEGIIRHDLNPNDRVYPEILGRAIELVESRDFDYLIEDLLEYSLERFLNRADDDPTLEYPQATFAEQENLAVITHIARTFDEKRESAEIELGVNPGRRFMFKYLTQLSNRRRTMHELYRNMNELEGFTGIVTRGLRKEGMDFVEKQLVGVSDVQVIYEKVMLSLLSLKPEGQGWLLEDDYKIGDQMVLDKLRQDASEHADDFNKSYLDAEGNLKIRPLRQWEITRAFHMGRDLSGASERRVVFGILGGVPRNADNSLKSIMHEPIARRLAPLKLIPDRFFGHPVARRFLHMLKIEQKRRDDGTVDYFKYGYVRKGRPIGFFGVDQGDTSITDLTITDPKSNSWRARLMFLKNPNFMRNIGGKYQTVGEFLDESTGEGSFGIHELRGDESTKERVRHHDDIRERKKEWNERPDIKSVLNDQRLFLGTLVRHGALSDENKAMIWGNIAELNPSSIAALFPNEALEIVSGQFDLEGDRDASIRQWMEIAQKLWTAERIRLNSDAKFLRSGQEGPMPSVEFYFEKSGITDPREIAVIEKLQRLDLDIDLTNRDDIERFNQLQKEMGKLNLAKPDDVAREKELQEEVISLRGRANAMILAKARFPFTAFLDDSPETDWSQTSDYDFTRLLVNDHNAYQEGYGIIMGVVDDSVMKLEEAGEKLIESFEKVKGPPGLEGAQRVFRPITRTVAKIRTMNRMGKWAGESIMKMLRKPASPVQEYNLQGEVADDEKQTAAYWGRLSQKDVVSDDPAERDEKTHKTPYEIERQLTDSDRKKVVLGMLRLMMQIFGPAFAMSFADAMGLKR